MLRYFSSPKRIQKQYKNNICDNQTRFEIKLIRCKITHTHTHSYNGEREENGEHTSTIHNTFHIPQLANCEKRVIRVFII